MAVINDAISKDKNLKRSTLTPTDLATSSPASIALYLFLLIISRFSNNRQQSVSPHVTDFLYNVSVVCVVAQTLAFISASAFRVSLYFLPFFGIFISNALSNRSQKTIRYIVMFIIIFYFLYTERNFGYHFIWEGVQWADPIEEVTISDEI